MKESRGWYFVEYRPPYSQEKFAMLNLVIVEKASVTDIVNAMEKELQSWLNRYPVPILVSAFDNKDDLFNLSELRSSNHVIGFFDQDGKIDLHWSSLNYEDIPDIALDQKYVDNLYSNLDFKTC